MNQRLDILIIEDSASQAMYFQLLLQRAGYTVLTVNNGAAGWQSAWDENPRLILLDVDLPSLDGFQVLLRLKRSATTAKIPVIMLTNREHVSDVERAITLGVNNYLFKGDAPYALCNIVRDTLDASDITSN